MTQKTIIASLVIILLTGVAFIADAKPNKGPQGGGLVAPTNLQVGNASSTQLTLSWLDTNDNEDGTFIERSLNGTTFIEVAQLGSNIATYVDIDLVPSTTYYYRVRAFRIAGKNLKYSDYSNTSSATTLGIAPAAPTSFSATPGYTSASTSVPYIDLAWTDVADNENSYILERAAQGSQYSLLVMLGANSESYRDTDVTSGITYYYRLRASNTFGDSSFVYASATAFTPLPIAGPTNLTAVAGQITGSSTLISYIDLTWQDNADNEDGFVLERTTNQMNFAPIVTFYIPNLETYRDYDVATSTSYSYRIKAFNSTDESPYSNIASTTTL